MGIGLMKLIEERPFSMADSCSDLCFLYSSNLLTEPARLYALKGKFLVFIALSSIGESQVRCFQGEVTFGDYRCP